MLVKLGICTGQGELEPEMHPLRAQLAAYLGASKLIFEAGSAVHVLELLGRLDADVAILNRVGMRGSYWLKSVNTTGRCEEFDEIGSLNNIELFLQMGGFLRGHLPR